MNKKSFALKQKLRPHKFLGSQYFILAFFWLIFIALLMTALILFLQERAQVDKDNNVAGLLDQISKSNDEAIKTGWYQKLLVIKYPLIDFSLLSFQFGKSKETQISDYSAAWTQRVNSINTAYSYIFITILIALIGFVYYIVVIIKLYKRNHFEKKYGLSTQFVNDYPIYDTKMYLGFVINLAIVFSFFNFLTTLIVLVYGAVLVLTSYFFWYVLKNDTQVLVMRKWWKSPNFALFTTVLLFQNGYTLLKAVFAQQFNVNLDLILSIILPIGTITIVITLLIRNMLATQVSAVKNAIKTIGAKVSAFQIFYYTQREKALEDYTFVSALPTFVKLPLQNNSINTKQALVLMQTIDETVSYFNSHFTKPKELHYMLYHLFNNVVDIKEIAEIKSNIVKTNKKGK